MQILEIWGLVPRRLPAPRQGRDISLMAEPQIGRIYFQCTGSGCSHSQLARYLKEAWVAAISCSRYFDLGMFIGAFATIDGLSHCGWLFWGGRWPSRLSSEIRYSTYRYLTTPSPSSATSLSKPSKNVPFRQHLQNRISANTIQEPRSMLGKASTSSSWSVHQQIIWSLSLVMVS